MIPSQALRPVAVITVVPGYSGGGRAGLSPASLDALTADPRPRPQAYHGSARRRKHRRLTLWGSVVTLGAMKRLRLSLGLCLMGAACQRSPDKTALDTPPAANVPAAPAPAAPPHADAAVEHARLFFGNQRYIETGDESLPLLVPEERALAVAGTTRAQAAVDALAEGPTSKAAAAVIPKSVRVLGVRVEGDIAVVDFARAGLSGGSLEERMMVAAIVQTLTALPGIHAVRFTVEGQRVETLMGHLDVRETLTADAGG